MLHLRLNKIFGSGQVSVLIGFEFSSFFKLFRAGFESGRVSKNVDPHASKFSAFIVVGISNCPFYVQFFLIKSVFSYLYG